MKRRLWTARKDDQPQRRRSRDGQETDEKRSKRRGQQLFRRNRTLVGSLSPQVHSASELNGDLRSPRAHVHHLTAHRRKLTTVFLVVIIGACSLTWLLYEFTAGIHVSPTASGIVINEQRYQKAISDYFAMHPLERLRFMLNDKELTSYLATVVPEISSAVTNGTVGFATSQFDLTFRQPVAGWLIGSKQYYVDQDGVSFLVNYFEQPQVKIVDQSGVPQTTGTTVASSRFLRFIGKTVTLAKADGLVVNQAIIPVGTTHQVEVIVAGHTYPVKMSLDRPVGEQVEDMSHALRYLDARGQQPSYIDIRVSGKAYYK